MSARESTPASPTQATSGRYRIERDLATGGLGRVQVASRTCVTGRTVALKRLHAKYANDSVITRLLEREYQTLRGLSHPSVIEVYDYGVDVDGPFYTMELLDGSDLNKLAPLPARTACAHLRDVASSLALLHARRLLHRDVTPSNVRVTAHGRAKLIDFGALCSFGRAPNLIGTAPCVPPEALSLAGLDQRSDLFALGAVAYFVLTGRHAYPCAQLADLQRVWAQPLPAPSSFAPDVPPELDALVLSLLSLDPAARPSSAGEVIIRLNQIAGLAAHEETEDSQSYLLNPHLVGRDAELDALRQLAERARNGEGCSVLIEGEEGVGKSRLQERDSCSRRNCSATARFTRRRSQINRRSHWRAGSARHCCKLRRRSCSARSLRIARCSRTCGRSSPIRCRRSSACPRTRGSAVRRSRPRSSMGCSR